MRYVCVPQNAIAALYEFDNDLMAGRFLLEMCREVFGGDGPDLSAGYGDNRILRATYAAVAPTLMRITTERGDWNIGGTGPKALLLSEDSSWKPDGE